MISVHLLKIYKMEINEKKLLKTCYDLQVISLNPTNDFKSKTWSS